MNYSHLGHPIQRQNFNTQNKPHINLPQTHPGFPIYRQNLVEQNGSPVNFPYNHHCYPIHRQKFTAQNRSTVNMSHSHQKSINRNEPSVKLPSPPGYSLPRKNSTDRNEFTVDLLRTTAETTGNENTSPENQCICIICSKNLENFESLKEHLQNKHDNFVNFFKMNFDVSELKKRGKVDMLFKNQFKAIKQRKLSVTSSLKG